MTTISLAVDGYTSKSSALITSRYHNRPQPNFDFETSLHITNLAPVLSMSIPKAPLNEPKPRAMSSSTAYTSADDAEELRLLDATYERIRANIPDTPYILTVPSFEPRYHHFSRQEQEQWCHNTPFRPEEERLQYMSFLFREHNRSCFVVRTEVDEERDRRKQFGSGSAAVTPSQTPVAKKKITLSDYKNKQAGGQASNLARKQPTSQNEEKKDTPLATNGIQARQAPPVHPSENAPPANNAITPPSKKPSSVQRAPPVDTAPPVDNVKISNDARPAENTSSSDNTPPAEKSPPTAKALPLEKAPPTNKANPSKDAPQLKKRLQKDTIEVEKRREDAPPPTKKVRTSQPALDTSAPSNQSESTPHGLPPILSPNILPNPHGLPPMLSPNLPASVEAELERLEKEHKRTNSNGSSPSIGKALASARTSLSSTASVSKNESASQKLLHPDDSLKAPTHPARNGTPSPSVKNTEVVRQAPPELKSAPVNGVIVKPSPEKPEPKPSLIVKFKYGKKRVVEIRRILMLPSDSERKKKQADADLVRKKEKKKFDVNERKETAKPVDSIRKLESAKRPQTTPVPSAATAKGDGAISEKRHRLEEASNQPPSKRQKVPVDIDVNKRAHTPVPPATPSPALSSKSSAQKNNKFLTPRKDLRAAAVTMKRTDSQDSNYATPERAGTPMTNGNGPPSASKSNNPTSAPPTTSSRAQAIQQWISVSKHYNDLGRKLKRQQNELQKKGDATDSERKQGVVMSVECILAFVLAFYLGDYNLHIQSRPLKIETTWLTLIPMWRFFRNITANHPHLEGIRLLLGVVITDRIAGVLTSQLSHATSTTDSSPAENPTANASRSAVASDLSRDAAEQYRNLQHYRVEANIKLPITELLEQYPLTWAAQAKPKDVESGWETLEPAVGKLDGPFSLPVGVGTTPIQAVRFGVRFLEEWIKNEGVDYQLQLKL
ncbi:hypothetical protein M501DRAFT_1059585 [Patellaria atrata CBS 101060]|uniref:Uncharacterized protein n=1 Tax=Patellaria atrata CBS 101060 TaxID=1346257 RepID=A0A9P4VPU7_9PEZI|nr:hypothetical protein M501DRAFT_1059585 [Patellaria atrata CBS 101060]